MKTTLHLTRQQPPAPTPAHPSTVRLGLLVSAFAVVAAVLVHVLTDVPTAAIVLPVVVIGFTLSWFTTGHRAHDGQNGPHDDASLR